MQFTTAEQVEAVARAFPDRIAVEMVGGQSYTYRQLVERMERIAAALGDVPAGRNGRMVAAVEKIIPTIPTSLSSRTSCAYAVR